MPIKVSYGASQLGIDAVTQRFGVVLPSDYVAFLKKYNGLFIGSGSYCTIPLTKIDNGEIDFQELYSIDAQNPSFSLINANDIIDEVVCFNNPFVIGADPGGNPFVVNCNGIDGSVYYWDRTHLHDGINCDYHEVDGEGNLYKAFGNFREFYNVIMNSVGGDNSLIKEQF